MAGSVEEATEVHTEAPWGSMDTWGVEVGREKGREKDKKRDRRMDTMDGGSKKTPVSFSIV